eukprot:Hpha_TRINITY_DN16769_c4_g2::TRINITY_DN16769_c4_g2_i1::g.76979::m.76979
MMDKEDPMKEAAATVKGYCERYPLVPLELRSLFRLVAARLCVSVVISSYEAKLQPDNLEYVEMSARPAWDLLRKLRSVCPDKAAMMFLTAAGLASEAQQNELRYAAGNGDGSPSAKRRRGGT